MKCPAALLLVLAVFASAAPSADDLMHSGPGPNGKQEGFYVTADAWERTPEWVFDGKSPPPLPLSDAYPKAYDFIRKRFPKFEDFRLFRYSLNHHIHPRTTNRWYYTFDFMPLERGKRSIRQSTGLTVVVLMDGTVVEPQERDIRN